MIGYIILIIFFVGILFLVIPLVRDNCLCPESRIIYRYIPRTLEEEQKQPVYVSEIYKRMFREPSPWSGGANEIDTRNNEELNKYFISQN